MTYLIDENIGCNAEDYIVNKIKSVMDYFDGYIFYEEKDLNGNLRNFIDCSIMRVVRNILSSRKKKTDLIAAKDFLSYQGFGSRDFWHVVDWLRAAIRNNEPWLKNVDDQGRPKKLMKFSSLDQIVAEADKAMRLAAEREYQKAMSVPMSTEDEEVVDRLEDGYYVVRMLTPAALDRESAQMQHCIGQGAYDDRVKLTDKYAYHSLRDRFGKPHVTIEAYLNRSLGSIETISQIQGKQNRRPDEKYLLVLCHFLEKIGVLFLHASGIRFLHAPGAQTDVNAQ